MMILGHRFNRNLLAVGAVLSLCACRTPEARQEDVLATLRVHLEANRDGTDRNHEVPVYRQNPVLVNVDTAPMLTEANVSEARVVEVVGGFALQITFDKRGGWLLEEATSGNRGKHYAVFSQFRSAEDPTVSQSRWLAAPIISVRVVDGVLRFTPDASHEEAYQIARGLNNVAKRNHNTPADRQAADKKL